MNANTNSLVNTGMNMRLSFIVVLLLVVLGIPAYADTIIGPGLTASMSLTASGGTYNGSVTFKNSNSGNAGLIAWGLNLFGGSTVITSLTVNSTTGWTDSFYGTLPGNNGSSCNSGGSNGAICVDGFTNKILPFTIAVIPGSNGSLTFSFNGAYTGTLVLDNHLQANGCTGTAFTTDKQGTVNCDPTSTKWAYSDVVTRQSFTSAPEPASLTLLGAGLLGIGGLVRRRK